MQTNNNNTSETEKLWQDFTGTGSIYSYLRYKGINVDRFSNAETPTDSSATIKGGEPIGYR